MGDYSKALAPVVAWALKTLLWIVFIVGTTMIVYQFVPKEIQDWAFGILDKYLPTIARIFK